MKIKSAFLQECNYGIDKKKIEYDATFVAIDIIKDVLQKKGIAKHLFAFVFVK